MADVSNWVLGLTGSGALAIAIGVVLTTAGAIKYRAEQAAEDRNAEAKRDDNATTRAHLAVIERLLKGDSPADYLKQLSDEIKVINGKVSALQKLEDELHTLRTNVDAMAKRQPAPKVP